MNKKSGSYTVEAALLYPLVIMIIIGMICTCFVMHDRGIAYACISEMVEKEVCLVNSEVGRQDDESTVIDEIYKECKKHMFISEIEKVSCSYKSDYITVNAVIKTAVPIYKDKEIKVKQYSASYTDKVRKQYMVN